MTRRVPIYWEDDPLWCGKPPLPVCAICQRDIPVSQQDDHHLIPKSKNGKITQTLHRVCHRQIHALFSENELAKTYNSAEVLLTHPEIKKFVAWVRTKPPNFLPSVKQSTRLK